MPRLLSLKSAMPGNSELAHVSGHESLGRVFEYELEVISDQPNVNPMTLLGTNVTWALEMPTGEPRYFNAYITRFSDAGEIRLSSPQLAPKGVAYRYRMTAHAWLWFLSQTSTTRVFQNKSVPDIVREVLNEHKLGGLEVQLTASYRQWEYCVQYRETDLNFVSRLLEQEGIYYYYQHTNGSHTVVLCDDTGRHETYRSFSSMNFGPVGGTKEASEQITSWSRTAEIHPGSYALNDFDFKNPRGDMNAIAKNVASHKLSGYEMYDFPGEYVKKAEGMAYAKVRVHEMTSNRDVAHGAGNVRGIHMGHRFFLAGHPRSAQNKTYYLSSVSLDISNNLESSNDNAAEFRASFTALEEQVQFRPARITPKPVVQGPQTAIVVGDSEIPTDEHGRVKVRFHWDRTDQITNNTCWIRVAQAWAGGQYGFVAHPRKGTEVVVSFLEGDPDEPLITGRVYNADTKHPFDPQQKKTVTGIKTLSEGGGGYNEFQLDDKSGSEVIAFRAQKDWRTYIKESRFEKVLKDQHLTLDGDRKEKIKGDAHLEISGDSNQKVTGGVSLNGSMDIQLKSGMKFAAQAGTEVHLKAGTTLVLEAGVGLSLKVGGNFITMLPAGIFIQGTMVMINSGGAALSGSGSSPQAPQAPTTVEDGKPGKQPPMPTPNKATKYSPQAQAMKLAAKRGTPFVAVQAH